MAVKKPLVLSMDGEIEQLQSTDSIDVGSVSLDGLSDTDTVDKTNKDGYVVAWDEMSGKYVLSEMTGGGSKTTDPIISATTTLTEQNTTTITITNHGLYYQGGNAIDYRATVSAGSIVYNNNGTFTYTAPATTADMVVTISIVAQDIGMAQSNLVTHEIQIIDMTDMVDSTTDMLLWNGATLTGTSHTGTNAIYASNTWKRNPAGATTYKEVTVDSNGEYVSNKGQLKVVTAGSLDPDGANNTSTTKATPNMTSASSPSGLVISDSTRAVGSYDPWRAFDGITGTHDSFASGNGQQNNCFIGYIFTTPKVINKILISAQHGSYQNTGPKDFTVQGSNDATNGINGTWDVIASITNITGYVSGVKKTITFQNATSYKAYKIHITADNGAGYVGIDALDFIEATGTPPVYATESTQEVNIENLVSTAITSSGTIKSVWYDSDRAEWGYGGLDPDGANNTSTTKATPNMTSASSPSGLVISNSTRPAGSLDPWMAFDGITGLYNSFASNSGQENNCIIGYIFTTPKVINKILISAQDGAPYQSRGPKDFTVQGSNDATNGVNGTWDVIASITNITGYVSGVKKIITFQNATSYKAYRLHITADNGAGLISIDALDFIEAQGTTWAPETNPANGGNLPTDLSNITDVKAYLTGDGSSTPWWSVSHIQGQVGSIESLEAINDLGQVWTRMTPVVKYETGKDLLGGNSNTASAVPTFTSADPRIIASHPPMSYYGGGVWNGLDATSAVYWTESVNNVWIGYKFDNPIIIDKVMVGGYVGLYALEKYPKDFVIEASNNTTDGTDGSWALLYAHSGLTLVWLGGNLNINYFLFPNTVAYKTYRLRVIANAGNLTETNAKVWFIETQGASPTDLSTMSYPALKWSTYSSSPSFTECVPASYAVEGASNTIAKVTYQEVHDTGTIVKHRIEWQNNNNLIVNYIAGTNAHREI
jgi:hypothetical protein